MTYKWMESNKQPYLYVEAEDNYSLGVGVGKGLNKQITFIHKNVIGMLAKTGVSKEKIMILVNEYKKFIPENYLEEIKGMYDGYKEETNEGIEFDDILLQAVFINLIYKAKSMLPEITQLMGCTNFGVINSDGTVAHGQNYDADGRLTGGNAFIHQKLKGEPELFSYRTGADLGTATAKSETGICMTVSVILSKLAPDFMTPRSVLIREAMKKETAIEVLQAMTDEQGRSPFSYNLIISDTKTIVASQATPFEHRIVQVKNQIVQSNQYDYFDWVEYLDKPSYSKKRQLYSEQLLNSLYSRYGKITNEDLLEILRDEPVICRRAKDDGMGTTVLFFTRESFGLGTAKGNVGILPI